MESINLDLADIYDQPEEDSGHEDNMNMDAMVENDDENREANVDVLAQLHRLAKGAAKKVVKRPQPKLDTTRLGGPRGFSILPKVFEQHNFKGPGYEVHDLSLLMNSYEHWAHRLFPRMTFDEVISRIEKLGAKREIQVMVKKMRMGIPLLIGEEPETQIEEDDDEEAALDAIFRSEPMETDMNPPFTSPTRSQITNPSPFDPPFESQSTDPPLTPPAGSQTTNTPPIMLSTSDIVTQSLTPTDGPDSTTTNNFQTTQMTTELSETQRERMERNKKLALERRRAKLGMTSPHTDITA